MNTEILKSSSISQPVTPRIKFGLALNKITELSEPILSLSPRKVRIKSASRRKKINCTISTVERTIPLTSREANPMISQQQQTLLYSGHSSFRGQTRNVNSFDLRQSEGQSTKAITIDQVTPELAAQIIRQYVLPMFDSNKP
jgi:hypothetical protein